MGAGPIPRAVAGADPDGVAMHPAPHDAAGVLAPTRTFMRLLHIDTSAQRAGSVTRRLSAEFVRSWVRAHPDTRVDRLDLDASPPSQIDERWIAAAFSPPESHGPALAGALRESDALVDQLVPADVVVMGVPMYNFTIPATLKAYIDQVVRAGRTFRYNGPVVEGLAGDKQVVVITGSMGDYGPESPIAFMNFLDPYLRAVLGFMGITDVTIVNVHGYDDASRAPSMLEARRALAEIVVRSAAGSGGQQ